MAYMRDLIYVPSNTSQKIVRQQTFRIWKGSTFASIFGQLAIVLNQLHESKFTGKVEIDFGQGTITSVNTIDSQNIDPI